MTGKVLSCFLGNIVLYLQGNKTLNIKESAGVVYGECVEGGKSAKIKRDA